jgi:hypothetical protein
VLEVDGGGEGGGGGGGGGFLAAAGVRRIVPATAAERTSADPNDQPRKAAGT